MEKKIEKKIGEGLNLWKLTDIQIMNRKVSLRWEPW